MGTVEEREQSPPPGDGEHGPRARRGRGEALVGYGLYLASVVSLLPFHLNVVASTAGWHLGRVELPLLVQVCPFGLFAFLLANENTSATGWIETHQLFQVRTFWMGLLLGGAGGLLSILELLFFGASEGIGSPFLRPSWGPALLLFTTGWFAARSLSGLWILWAGREHPRPRTWWV